MRTGRGDYADVSTVTGDIVKTVAIGANPNLALILIFSLNIWVNLGLVP